MTFGRDSHAWFLRPIVWFAAASMLTTILHEFAHALTAYVLGVPSTLYNYAADVDLTSASAHQHAVIGAVGPAFCLAWGALGWFALRRAPGSAELPLLYVSVFGIGTFFGNLMSAAFVGDFSTAAVALGLPIGARYAISIVGLVSAAALHFWGGCRLLRWVPINVDRATGMIGIIAVPVVLGTAIVIVVNQPLVSASTRAAEALFWVFAAIAAMVTRRRSPDAREVLRLRWIDAVVMLLAVVIVRLMVRGIRFVP